jgi:hypothetical protein
MIAANIGFSSRQKKTTANEQDQYFMQRGTHEYKIYLQI